MNRVIVSQGWLVKVRGEVENENIEDALESIDDAIRSLTPEDDPIRGVLTREEVIKMIKED